MSYQKAYYEMKEVMKDSGVEKAIMFAHLHPTLVYGINSVEYDRVANHGFFDQYCSLSNSTSAEDGA
jgi:hypothetical protein